MNAKPAELEAAIVKRTGRSDCNSLSVDSARSRSRRVHAAWHRRGIREQLVRSTERPSGAIAELTLSGLRGLIPTARPCPISTVEAGKLADLIVVAANPLEDITNLRRVQLVLKEGRVVSDKRHLSGAVP